MEINETDFCVIDTETTGGSALFNRVIDVAVFHVRDGEVMDKFETLVNPGRPIPPWITHLTGITDRMVDDAPTFFDIADSLKGFLDRGVFTAHNAAFDYGFIREEYKRLGIDFCRPQCCTLKLSRHLYDDLRSRSLGVLCESLLIDIWDRHRAHGDAEATVYVLKEILRKVRDEYDVSTWEDLENFSRYGRLRLPEGLTYRSIHNLPSLPGEYIFKDADGNLVHKGKAKDVQRRVRSFFQERNHSDKSNRFRDVVRSIELI